MYHVNCDLIMSDVSKASDSYFFSFELYKDLVGALTGVNGIFFIM